MKRRVAVFFPQNPFPPEAGLHKRCLEMLRGLSELGCDVHLLSSPLTAYRPWEPESVAGLKGGWATAVHLHRPNAVDYRFRGLLQRYYRFKKRPFPFDSSFYSPPGMRAWFARTLHDLSPDVVVMNYSCWDRLMDHRRLSSTLRIIDTLDLMSLNSQMWQLLEPQLPAPPIRPCAVADQVVREDFYQVHGLAPLPRECKIFDRYNYTISITQQEAELIRRQTRETSVVVIPMTHEPQYVANHYSGPALLTTGPNPFNVQGYLYFAKRVLPLVRRRAGSFCLQVTGYCSQCVVDEDNVLRSGFVPDLRPVFEAARFAVCPVFGGTGQQVKIVEAMAYGLPVVALRAAADRSPLRHGVNGLVADGAEEFAEHVARLWADPGLCRRLGAAARQTVAAEASRGRLLEGLAALLR